MQPFLETSQLRWLTQWLSTQRLSTEFKIHPLAGDGSPRPFYRIEIPNRTFVLLIEPAWTLSKDYPVHQAYLEREGVPVPQFLAVDEKLGLLLMEDLGDVLLQARLLETPEEKRGWLEEATRLLARLHGSTFPVPTELPVSTRRFDAEKYGQELAFTIEHLHVGLLKLSPLDKKAKKEIELFCHLIAAFGPDVFCHRDYHTRNLLVHEERLRLIDFQDARLGPIEYDLASLFFDAYVPIAPGDRTHLLGLYRQVLKAFALDKAIEWGGFEKRLDLVAFQRVVKAAGSFASFYTRYGKQTHLPYLVPALEMARTLYAEHSASLPQLPLDEWISKARALKVAK